MTPKPVSFLRACTLGAVFVLGASCAPGGRVQRVVEYGPGDRRVAPQLSGDAVRGEPVSSTAFAGKVLVVNFWGSWCGPCRKEQPILESLSKRYAENGVAFLGVSVRDQRAAATAYLDEFGVTYPSIYDPSASLSYRFGLAHMPGSYVIDRQGKIAAMILGAVDSHEELTDVIDRELRA